VNKWLGPYQDRIYAVVRFVVGFLLSFHGAQKLFGAFGGDPVPLVSQTGLGGVIEFFGGLLIAIGLFASWAAFIASGMMAVAYFQFHQPGGLWPIVNHGELAVVYCFIFLYIAAKGAGKWSVASLMKNPKLS
jgi:putative oxidoreductase